MPALRTRKAARERITKVFQTVLDRLVPADESKPLRGRIFAEFEEHIYKEGNEILAALLEERAQLAPEAEVEEAGRCPHCGCERTYLEKRKTKQEIRSPVGMVVLERQSARCRSCDRSFSPSGERLGVAD